MNDAAAEKREVVRQEVVDSSHTIIEKTDNLVKGLAVAIFVLMITVAGLGYQVQVRNDQIDEINDLVEHINEQADQISEFTERTDEVLTELREVSPTEQAQDQAISRAVRLVPEIREILCEVYPTASACLE